MTTCPSLRMGAPLWGRSRRGERAGVGISFLGSPTVLLAVLNTATNFQRAQWALIQECSVSFIYVQIEGYGDTELRYTRWKSIDLILMSIMHSEDHG